MAAIAVTYTFSNSTTADATQVNQNFTDITNGLSDGTKDISVSAVTAAGNLSVSGNTTIGNASGDDLTVTASLASSIPIKTTNSYDIGSSTLGLRALYFGANSQTVKLQGSSSMSATWTWTFPVTAGTTGMTLITDGAGVTSWRYTEKTVSKTNTYTGTGDETTILCDASGGSFTVNLPAAASYTGKHFYIKKTDSSYANSVVIDGNASETIDGALTRSLFTQYEAYKLISDGSNWHIVEHQYNSAWQSFSPTFNNITVTSSAGYWRRVGDSMHIRACADPNGSATGVISLTIPNSLTIASGKLPGGTSNLLSTLGVATGHPTTTAPGQYYAGNIQYDSSTAVRVLDTLSTAGDYWRNAVPATWASSGTVLSFDCVVPITGWEG